MCPAARGRRRGPTARAVRDRGVAVRRRGWCRRRRSSTAAAPRSSTAPFAGAERRSVACAERLLERRVRRPRRGRRGASRGAASAPLRGRIADNASLPPPMPIYEYKCPNGHLFEVFHGMTEAGPRCARCAAKAPLQLVLHPVPSTTRARASTRPTTAGRRSSPRRTAARATPRPARRAAIPAASGGSSDASGGERRSPPRPRRLPRSAPRPAPRSAPRATPARFSTVGTGTSPTRDVFGATLEPVPRVGGG